VTGALYGFQPADPNIHRGIQDDHRSLLLQRYRSLYRSLLVLNTHLSEKRGLYAFSTNLTKKYGIFDISGVKAFYSQARSKRIFNSHNSSLARA
jgi:hypothetical protein